MSRTIKIEERVTNANGSVMAHLDLERVGRCGTPEAIFAAGKTPEETLAIATALVRETGHALVTRAAPPTLAALRERWPNARFADRGGTAIIGAPAEQNKITGDICIVAAGTSDLSVAEEAAFPLDMLGITHSIIPDVGVAGLHRLIRRLEAIRAADVVIAIAGMEGALPSVLAGLIPNPVIAVPTSVGYGASFSGLSALLGMLNSCSPGIAVVNIDNGFGAAVLASRIMSIGRRSSKDS